MSSFSIGRMKRILSAACVALALVGISASPSGAIDHGSMGVMTPENTYIKEEFPPVAGVHPAQSGAQPFSLYNSWGCVNYSYCNRHVFEVKTPKNYLDSFKGTDIVSYGVKVTLTWPDPENNDLDLFVSWAVESAASGAPGGPCSTPNSPECDNLKVETYSVVEPKPADDDPETEEDESAEPAEIYMSVVNDSGVNTGYTLELQWFLIPFGSFPEFEPPKGREVSRPVTASRTPQPFAAEDDDSSDAPDPETKILIPGPDGKLVEQELGFLASGHRFKTERSGTASWVWIVTTALSALSLAVFAVLVWRRRGGEART